MSVHPLFWLAPSLSQGPGGFSRTDVVRTWQRRSGHAPCFGTAGKFRPGSQAITPRTCGEHDCPVRAACEGLHEREPFGNSRLREQSVELLSRILLNVRLLEGAEAGMTHLEEQILGLIEHWSGDTPQVALLGAFSSGKSTLLSALLGDANLLPSGRLPTTGVVTAIEYGSTATGTVVYKPLVRLGLLLADGRSPDVDAVDTLLSWAAAPEHFGITDICELTESGGRQSVDRIQLQAELLKLQADLKAGEAASAESGVGSRFRRVVRGRPVAVERYIRTFEVAFAQRRPAEFRLEDPVERVQFHAHLSNPALALRLSKAICRLPDPRLRALNLLDTAGLCSPISFHTAVTEELLLRRPDKLLVLLDARRLEADTNRETLHALRRFVSEPADFCRVSFVLTFWDQALRNYMEQDSEEELSFSDPTERRLASEKLANARRRRLREMLEDVVGIACPSDPVAYPIGLGPHSPADLRAKLNGLWNDLLADSAGWLGVELWFARWRAAGDLGARLLQLLERVQREARAGLDRAEFATDVQAELERLAREEKTLSQTVRKQQVALQDCLDRHLKFQLAEIQLLDTKKALLRFCEEGYGGAATSLVEAVEVETAQQAQRLAGLLDPDEPEGVRSELPVMDLDRKLMGLDDDAAREVKGKVTGFGYVAKSVWDFFFSGITELTAGNRSAARDILKRQMQGLADVLRTEVVRRNAKLDGVLSDRLRRIKERRLQAERRQRDRNALIGELRRRVASLEAASSPCQRIAGQIHALQLSITQAKGRIDLAREEDFAAYLTDELGQAWPLKRGREEGMLLLHRPPAGRWRELVMEGAGQRQVFYPRGRGAMTVTFDPTPAQGFAAPVDLQRLDLRLASMTGLLRPSRSL